MPVKAVVQFMRCQVDSERDFRKLFNPREAKSDEDVELQPSADEIFKRHFCVAAQDLADEVRQPLEELGIIYDDVLATTRPSSRFAVAMGYSRLIAGKGQVMFTVRRLKKEDASRLAAAGFRFTIIDNVSKILSRRIHIPAPALTAHLKDMRDLACTGRRFEPGIHLVSFIMRPTVQGHFEVLTVKGTGNPLPSSTLSAHAHHPRKLELIAHMEGRNIPSCLDWLNSAGARVYRDVDDFRQELIQAIESLSRSLPRDVNHASTFSPRPLVAPCRDNEETLSSDENTCILLAFCARGSLDTRVSTQDHAFIPLRLFHVQQQANRGGTGKDGSFANGRDHDLFYSDAETKPSRDSEPMSPVLPAPRFWQKKNPSVQGVNRPKSPFRGIMVEREVKVDVTTLATESSAVSNGNSKTSIVTRDMDSLSYVDELCDRCYARKLLPCQYGM